MGIQKSYGFPRSIYVLVIVIALLLVPNFLSYFYTRFIALLLLTIGCALAYNIIFGFTGLFSLGHGAFFGLSGYVFAICISRFHISFEVSMMASVLITVGVATILGVVLVRVRDIYFAFLTLGFGWLFYTLILKLHYITGGTDGLYIRTPQILWFNTTTMPLKDLTIFLYYFIIFLLIIFAWFIYRLNNSPLGLTFKAIRDNPDRAEFIGINVKKYKLYALVISTFWLSIMGALYASVMGIMTPTVLHYSFSLELAVMVLLGGGMLSPLWGTILGAGVYYILKYYLSMVAPAFWNMLVGILICVIIFGFREGIVGRIRFISKKEG
jgi:branched-chain amino acid transport system permease protein